MIVEIGPTLPIIENLLAPILFIAKETNNEGIKVDIIDIKRPNT